MLRNPDCKVRKNAIEALGDSPGSRSIPKLIESLEDQEPEVVRAAIISLGRIGRGSEPAREAVTRFVAHPDSGIAESAVVAVANISGIEDAQIPAIVKSLGTKEEALTKLTIATMARADVPTFQKIVPELMQTLQSGQEPAVENTVFFIRHMSTYSDQLSEALVTVYDKVKPETQPQILAVLSLIDKTGSKSTSLSLEAFKDPAPATRRQAIVSLARSARDVNTLLPVLNAALKDPDLDVRVQAFMTIRAQAQRIPDGFPLVVPGIRDENPKIRIAALNALSGFKKGPQEPIQIWEQIAREDKSPEVRAAAFAALAEVSSTHNANVIPFLEKALETEEDAKIKSFLSKTVDVLRRRMALEKGGMIPGEQLGR